MAFAAYAYVMENVILFFFPGGAFSHILKPPRGVFVLTAQPHRGAFAAFPKKNDKYPINARGDGHVFNWLSHYHFSLPWEIITPGEDYHLSLPRGLLGLLHHCVEKSDLLSIFGLLHLLPLPPQTFWSSSLLLAKELWVASIKSRCYSLFSDWLLRQPYRTSATPASRNAAVVCTI